jgi:hypothetical protein
MALGREAPVEEARERGCRPDIIGLPAGFSAGDCVELVMHEEGALHLTGVFYEFRQAR